MVIKMNIACALDRAFFAATRTRDTGEVERAETIVDELRVQVQEAQAGAEWTTITTMPIPRFVRRVLHYMYYCAHFSRTILVYGKWLQTSSSTCEAERETVKPMTIRLVPSVRGGAESAGQGVEKFWPQRERPLWLDAGWEGNVHSV
jgi:hypothetical protein